MMLWLDAKREPEVCWVWAKTPALAIRLLEGGCVERISFCPDQPSLVKPVVDWMIGNGVHPERSVHAHDAGAKPRHRLPTLRRSVVSR